MIVRIDSLDAAGVEVFASLTEAQLRNRLDPAQAMFIAESPKVIDVALNAGYEPVSLLCEERHIAGDAAGIIARCGDEVPVYTGSRELLAALTGYTLTRGVLCAMRRPVEKSVGEVCDGASRIVVIDGVVDTTNIGAIFRSAAASVSMGCSLPRPRAIRSTVARYVCRWVRYFLCRGAGSLPRAIVAFRRWDSRRRQWR